MLTIKRRKARYTVFGIPNYVVKKIYWEYFQNKLEKVYRIEIEDLDKGMTEMREKGNISLFWIM